MLPREWYQVPADVHMNIWVNINDAMSTVMPMLTGLFLDLDQSQLKMKPGRQKQPEIETETEQPMSIFDWIFKHFGSGSDDSYTGMLHNKKLSVKIFH